MSDYPDHLRERIESYLEALRFSAEPATAGLEEAMRYSLLAGGKRVRPVLALATARAIGTAPESILPAASALELIHTYSLVHDDLPALDNDDLRRGRKTAHIVFGEAMAILAGDALLTEGLSWLAEPIPGVAAERQLEAVAIVAKAVDSRGMIGGQVADIESERIEVAGRDRAELLELLQFIHRNKTGKLLTASVLLGGALGGAGERQMNLLREYGEAVGLAFQIVDDLLDIEETAETLGKTAGKDLQQGKLTYPALVGAGAAREELARLLDKAVATAGIIGRNLNYLGPIARYVCERRS